MKLFNTNTIKLHKMKSPEECMGKRRKAQMAKEDDTHLLRDNSSVLDEVGRYLSIGKVKRYISLGTDLFEAASPFLEKPTWWNAAKAVFESCKVFIEDVEIWAEDYFASDEWTEPYSSDFNQTLLHVLQRFPYERIKTSEENTYVRICTLPNGVRCGWTYVGKGQIVDKLYVETARLEDAQQIIKQLLWEQFKGKSLVMRKNSRVSMTRDARVVFEIDDAFESKLSKRATDYAEYLKRPISEGVPRSVMFYGPPGTGKSTLARTIVELMNMRSFRIRIGDLDGLDNSTLFEAINIFEPDAVILDDFDRAHAQAQLLETLEYFQQKVKLVIVTVNNRRQLDEALMRPERIDELYLIDSMDEEVVKHVLGPYIDGYEIVKDWPIAFIGEYVKRRRFMSAEEATESLKELTQRVGEMRGYSDEGSQDFNRMIKLLNKKFDKNNTVAMVDPLPTGECGEGKDIDPLGEDED